jgi:ubiquinol-cytochrome c reductase cytochrome c1 subunit
MNEEEFRSAITDLVAFLAYTSEPAKLQRLALGPWVLGFLVLFTIIAYLLKKEYWRDVH